MTLYESNARATYKIVAADLGIKGATLRKRVFCHRASIEAGAFAMSPPTTASRQRKGLPRVLPHRPGELRRLRDRTAAEQSRPRLTKPSVSIRAPGERSIARSVMTTRLLVLGISLTLSHNTALMEMAAGVITRMLGSVSTEATR